MGIECTVIFAIAEVLLNACNIMQTNNDWVILYLFSKCILYNAKQTQIIDLIILIKSILCVVHIYTEYNHTSITSALSNWHYVRISVNKYILNILINIFRIW